MPGSGVCTLRLGGGTFTDICRAYDVELIAAHRALDTGGVVVLAETMTVCFTGSATYPDGSELPRKRLNEIAAGLGLVPTNAVTKKSCHVLVTADTSSQSGKAGKARNYGIS